MRRIRPSVWLSGLVGLFVTGLTVAAYVVAQSGSGPQVYANSCSACHGAALEGGAAPALTGPSFQGASRNAAALFSFVSQQMPLSGPGSLSREQCLNVVTYLLQQNGIGLDGQPFSAGAAGQ